MESADILATAKDLVSGNRAKSHGDKLLNHSCIANMWTAYLVNKFGPAVTLDPHDICNMMELLKIARRQTGSFNVDDYIDGAGYASIAGDVQQQLIGKTKKNET
jgi:hypothetical protein